jgi:hypothetical protein
VIQVNQVNLDNQVNLHKLNKINELFMDHKLTNDNGYFNNFKKLYKSLHDKEYTDETEIGRAHV